MSARLTARISHVTAACLLALLVMSSPRAAHAVWNIGGKFVVGSPLAQIVPAPAATCGNQGGTSMALVQGAKLAGVSPTQYPILLVTSCLDNGPSASTRALLNFLDPATGAVVKSISTTIGGVVGAPSNGWAHLVLRPDKGDLLGCGNDGTIYSIAYSQFSSTIPGTATALPQPSGLSSCAALGWSPEDTMIYQGVTGGTNSVGVHHFVDGTTTDLGNFNTPCTPGGVTVSGGVLLVVCAGQTTVLRLERSSGTVLAVNGTLGILGSAAGTKVNPGLGDLACDPVTFQKDPTTGRDLFRDALWSRQGANGNGAVALEFPASTCGMPSKSVNTNSALGPVSPLAAGLSAPDAAGNPGAVPLAACFDATGIVVNASGDGLPDCWKTSGIDFNGDGITDLTLCVQVNENGDGVTLTQECADPNHKDLFVEVNWMQNHQPDPLALSQSSSVTSVQSVRAAFAAAPVGNPDGTNGIRIHFQVKNNPVFLNTLADSPGTPPSQVEVSELVFTPCTPPAVNLNGTLNVKSLGNAADFDAIKKLNFGTAADQASGVNTLNAKRLAFRWVLYAHNQTGANQLGSTASGCSALPGADAAITLGSFTATTLSTCISPACTQATHNRGTTDQQAGTLMHELGHTLGLRHGGGDNTNCKPNYLSVMSYTRQFAGSPIPGRRLDYSRVALPALNESSLSETGGLCPTGLCDAALKAISPFFPSADQTAYGPTVWSIVPATGLGSVCPAGDAECINWNRDKTKSGSQIIESSAVSAVLNNGAGGCSDTVATTLVGHDDWDNLVYRASAGLEFAAGVHTVSGAEHVDLTKEDADALFVTSDLDGNGIGDAQDCGTFSDGVTTSFCPPHETQKIPPEPICSTSDGFCSTHRIDIKPSASSDSTGAKTVSLGTNATITIGIFSEPSPSVAFPVVGNGLWYAPAEVILNNLTVYPLNFNVESLVFPVKVNVNGQGTCSARDIPDPITGISDGFKDLLCQFPTNVNGLPMPLGKHEGVLTGYFTDPSSGQIRAFRARQDFIVSQ